MNIPRPLLLAIVIVVILIFLIGCVVLTLVLMQGRTSGGNDVSGLITYPEQISLPDGIVAKVQIVDQSASDPANAIVKEETFQAGTTFPVPYNVPYDPNAIDKTHSYAIQAQIIDSAGALMFMNQSPQPIITQDNPSEQVDIPVEAVTAMDISAPSIQAAAEVIGVVTSLGQVTLPGDATVVVQLADVGAPDAPVQVVNLQTISNPGQLPVPFDVTYDPAVIDSGRNYAVSALIRDANGGLIYRSSTSIPVITQGNPTSGIQLLVEPTSGGQPQGTASVTGVLTYRENIALPATARATVRLVNLSLADNPLGIIAEQTIANPGQVPIPFDLKYDPNRIDQNLLYSIKASIDDGSGNMLFVTTRDYLVITQRNPVAGIEVVLDRIFKGLVKCLSEQFVCQGIY